jgi:hypothetical protein
MERKYLFVYLYITRVEQCTQTIKMANLATYFIFVSTACKLYFFLKLLWTIYFALSDVYLYCLFVIIYMYTGLRQGNDM